MAAFTTLLAAASLAVGVGGAVASANANKKALRQSQQQFDSQQTAAVEAGKVKAYKDTPGAKFKLGTSDFGLTRDDNKRTPAKDRDRTNTGNRAGGLTTSAAAAGGL